MKNFRSSNLDQSPFPILTSKGWTCCARNVTLWLQIRPKREKKNWNYFGFWREWKILISNVLFPFNSCACWAEIIWFMYSGLHKLDPDPAPHLVWWQPDLNSIQSSSCRPRGGSLPTFCAFQCLPRQAHPGDPVPGKSKIWGTFWPPREGVSFGALSAKNVNAQAGTLS